MPAAAPERWPVAFTLLWSGSAASLLGAIGVSTAAPLLALELTGSPEFVSYVVAATALPGLVLHLPAGLLVDRMNRWRTMLISQTARTLMSVTVVVFLGLGLFHPWLLVVAAVVVGTCTTFFNVAEVSYVPHLVEAHRLQAAMARNEGRTNAAGLLGRPIGGLLCVFGATGPYLVDAVLGACSVAALLRLRTHRLSSRGAPAVPQLKTFQPASPAGANGDGSGGPRSGRSSIWTQLAEGATWLWRFRFLRTALIACAATNFLFQIVLVLLIVRAKAVHLPVFLTGVLLAASSLGGSFTSWWVGSGGARSWFHGLSWEARFDLVIMLIPGAWLVANSGRQLMAALLARRTVEQGRRRIRVPLALRPLVSPGRSYDRRPLLLIQLCMWAWLVLSLLVAAVPSAIVWMFAWGGTGFMGARLNIALFAYQADRTPPRLRGRVAATNRFVTLGIMPAGTLFGGAAIKAVGAPAVAWGVPAAIATTGVLMWSARRVRVHRLRQGSMRTEPLVARM